MKKFIMIYALIATIFVGCSSVSNEQNNIAENKQIVNFENSKFQTDKITIHYDPGLKVGETNDGDGFLIEDKKIIKEIQDICIEGEFSIVPKQELLKGLCTIFLDFNNGTVIGIYEDRDYGNVEERINIIGRARYLPSGLNKYVNKLIKEYN